MPDTWLNYAALDVEVLVELREHMGEELERQGKTEWAAQEFEHVRLAPPAPPKPDRWRRTSGIHAIKSARTLAAVRELWTARDEAARRRDIAPSRVLPDSAIVAAAQNNPTSTASLRALPVFGGPRQRRQSRTWMDALETARSLPDDRLPPTTQPFVGPPPVSRWARRDPEAAARLASVREAMSALSENVSVPVENLLTPDVVRRLCWDWPTLSAGAVEPTEVIAAFLVSNGARSWQQELTVPVLASGMAAAAAASEQAEVTDQ